MTIDEEEDILGKNKWIPSYADQANTSMFSETFLEKLRSLRIDCVLLHDTLESVLLTSGVCKKYTVNRPKNGYYYDLNLNDTYRRLVSSKIRSLDEKICLEYEFDEDLDKEYNDLVLEASKRKKQQEEENPQNVYRIFDRKPKRETSRQSLVLSPPYMLPTESTRRRSSFSSTNPRQRYSGLSKLRTGPLKTPWYPKITVPEPFQMTIREQIAPTKAMYAEKFLKQLLAEKELKEMKELEKLQTKFQANPVPKTTYKSDSKFYIGELKRSKSLAMLRADKINKSKRAESQPELSHQPFHAHPVPITTYIHPTTSMSDLRGAQKQQRAVELLAHSWAPRGLDDHSIRSHVVYQIRHIPKCFPAKPTFQPKISKSVPDFRLLHKQWEEHLQRIAPKPATFTSPFHFHEDYHRHHCQNIDEYMSYYRQNMKRRKNF